MSNYIKNEILFKHHTHFGEEIGVTWNSALQSMDLYAKDQSICFLEWQQEKGYYQGPHQEWYSHSGELIGSSVDLYELFRAYQEKPE